MKVLIVAKTRMRSGVCIGAITEEGESVRLNPLNEDPSDSANQEYQVGDVWEISFTPATSLIPPHIEDVVVSERHRLGSARNLIDSVERLMPPQTGAPEVLYESLLQTTGGGALYIAERSGVPPYSTTFWRPNRSLTHDIVGGRVRYCYLTENESYTLPFVGFQEPLDTIPAGTLVRVSLARWWRPDDTPDIEERCYAQLSGWFPER